MHSVRERGTQVSACILATCATFGIVSDASALEGFPQYAVGADTTYSGAVPPVPGFFGGISFGYAGAGTFRNAAGESVDPNLKFDIGVAAAIGAYAWETEFLGGRPITFATVPFLKHRTQAAMATPMGPFSFLYDDATLGDISIGQLVGWQLNDEWSVMAGLEVFLPTGSWLDNGFISNGANYTTFYPQFRATYKNTRNDHFSVKALLGFPTKNENTGYKSGTHLVVEGAYGWGISENLGLDIAFSGLYQLEDDEGPGVDPSNGNRSRVFGIGPQIRYRFGPHDAIQMTVKYLHEFGARRYPEGGKFLVQFAAPLWVPEASRRELGIKF